MAMPFKQYILIRLIAGFLAVVFLCQETAHAAGGAADAARRPAVVPVSALSASAALEAAAANPALLPSAADAVRAERFVPGTNGRLIVLLRDAHANLSAQKNIFKAAEFWARQAGIDLILSEAAWGEAGLGDARGVLPAAELKRASDRLLWENLITGHEYLTLVSELPVRVVGIEDPRLYRRNWEVFRRMVSGRERVGGALARSRAAVDGMKRRDYPKALLDHEAAAGRNEDWVLRYRAIRGLAAGSDVLFDAEAESALEPFHAAEAMERSIDHDRLAKEQELALGGARTRCGPCADDLMEAFKKAGPSVAALHSAVGRLTRASGLDARGPASELVRYQRYLESVEALDPAALDAALDTLEEDLYAGLARSRDARVTRFVDRHTRLLESAYRLRLTPEEVRRLGTELLRVRPVSWQAEVNDRLIEQGRVEDILAYEPEFASRLTAVRNFYRLAALRDRVFVRRSDEVLTASGERAALVVTGGYHTDRLTELFAKRGYSVAVFTPYVTEETDQAVYERTVLASDPDRTRPSSGTRLAAGAASPDRSTLLAPLVRTPAGAARLASAIPALPAGPGTLAKELLKIGAGPSAAVPVRSAARMPDADKRDAIQRYVRWHRDQFLGPSAEQFLGPIHFFETPEAFFVFHGGIHAVTTPEQDHAGLVDAYVIENADAFFFGSDEWTRPADFFDHDVQYRGIARAARSAGIPIYLVDTPVVERAPADGPEKSTGPDPAVTARGLFRALLLIAAPLALIFWHPFIGLAFFLAAAHFYAFSFMYEALVHHRQWGIWPLEVLGFLDAGAVGTQRSALAAHKIASVVLPHLREGREGGKPLIWVDWGASHADMVPLLRYPALRTAVLRFERVLHPIRRQPKPDLRYADQAVWMRFEDGPSDRAALVGRVIGPRGQAGRPGGLFAWSFGLTAALHGATSWWTRAALPMPDDIGRNGLFFDVTQHHERLGDWWQAVRATAEEVLGYYSRILGMDYEIVRGDHAPPGVDWERYWLFFIPAAAAYHFVFRRFGPVSRFGSGLALGGWFANHLEGYLRGGVVTNMIQVRSSESVSITNTADIAIAAGVLLVVSAAAFRAVKKLTSNGARMASRQRGKRKKSARPQAAPSIQAKTVTTHLFLEGQGASFTDLAGAKSSIEMIVSNDPAVASGAILTLRSNDLSGHDLRAVHVLQSNEKHRRHPRGPVRIVELESPAWTKRYRSQIRYTIHPSDVVEISAALTKGPPIRLRYKKVKDLMGLMHHEFKRIGDPSRVPIISSAAGPGARMSESPPARTVPGTLFHRIAPAEEAVSIALPETYLEASTKELSEVHLEGLRRDLGLEAPLTPDRARDLIHSSLADPKAWRFLKLLYEFDQRHPSPAGRRDAAYAALERHYREHRWAWPKYHAVHRNKLILKFKRTLAEGTGREKLIREAGLTALPENADPVEALMARLPLRDQIVLRRYYTLGVFGTSDAEKLSVPAQILADVRSRAPEDRDRWKSEDNLSAYRRNLVRELKEHAAKRPDSRLIKLPRRLLRDGRSFADGREVLAHDAGLLPTALTEERFRVLEPFDRLAVEVHYALTDRSLSLEDAVTEVLAVMRSAGLTPPPIMTEGGLTYRVGRAVELLSRYADGWERLRGELFGASAPAADEVRRRVESLPPLSARVLMADHGIGVQASGDDGDLARSLTAETGAPVSIDQVREARWNGWHAIGAEKGDERLKSALWLYGREAVNATPPAEEGAVRVFIWSPAVSGAWRPSGRAGFGPAAAVQKHKLYLPGRDVTEEVWSVDWKPEAGGTYAELMEFLKLSPAARMYPGVTGVDELSSSAPFDPASARPVHGSVITVRPAPEDVYQIPSAPSASPRLREEFWKSVPAADPAKDIVISANGLERLLEGRRALLLEHFAELPDPFEYPEGSITMGPFRFELKRNRYTPVWTLERTQRNLDELARVTGRRLKTEASAEAKRAESERQAAERKEIRELLLDANAPARSRRFSLPVRGRTIFLFKAADDKGVSRDAEIALPPVEGPVYFRVLRSRAGGRYIAVYEEATRKPVILNRFDGHAKFTRHRTALPYRRQVAKQVPTDSPRTAAEPRPVRTKAEKKPRVPKPAAASKNTRPVRLKRSAPNAPSAAGPKGPAAAEPRPAAKDALKETLTSVALRRDAQHFQILMYFKRTGIEGRRFGRFIDGFDAASNNSGHLPQEINRNALFRHAQYAAGSDLPLYRVTLDEGQLDWSALQIFEALGYSKDRAFDPATTRSCSPTGRGPTSHPPC
jgi:hypothetical protein